MLPNVWKQCYSKTSSPFLLLLSLSSRPPPSSPSSPLPLLLYCFSPFLLFLSLLYLIREKETHGDSIGIMNTLNALGNTHSRRAIPHLSKYVSFISILIIITDVINNFRRYLSPHVNTSINIANFQNDTRLHINMIAAHSLRGIPGTYS